MFAFYHKLIALASLGYFKILHVVWICDKFFLYSFILAEQFK